MTTSLETHWRARLRDLEDDLLVAKTLDEVAGVVLHLMAVLRDEWGAHETPIGRNPSRAVRLIAEADTARELVAQAVELFSEADSTLSLRLWFDAARAYLGRIETAAGDEHA